jgi:hypothetical protein
VEYFRRLGNFWFPKTIFLLWLLFAAMALYFFQTFIHEGSHAVAGVIATGNSPTLAPFPHEAAGGRGFLNGVTIVPGNPSNTETIRLQCDSPAKTTVLSTGFIGTPQMVDLVIITLLFLLFFFIPVSNPIIRFLLVVWYLGASFDFIYNTMRSLIGGCNPGADWSRVMLEGDINNGVFAFLTWMLWIIFILSHFVWVYWSKWGQTPVDNAGFWDYSWIGLVCGLLSLTCVIWSLAVSNPSIIKDSAPFILFFILHIVFAIGNFLLFGLSFKYKT